MSFNTDPDLYSFLPVVDDCLQCFASGRAPDIQFAQFTGIQIGDTWLAGDPAPPNGLFQIDFVGSCHWQFDDATYQIIYQPVPLNMLVTANVIGVETAFSPTVPATSCDTEFDNFFASPIGRKYFGGRAIVMNPLDSGPHGNIELMNLLNILPEDQTFANPQALDVDILTSRYSRQSDRTNVYIKYDFT